MLTRIKILRWDLVIKALISIFTILTRMVAPSQYVQRLDKVFTIKPYYKEKESFYQGFILHFHGLKPQDILRSLMGHPKSELSNAVKPLYDKLFEGDRYELVCLVLHDFAVAIADDEKNMQEFCKFSFTEEPKERVDCNNFSKTLVSLPEKEDCGDVLRKHGYTEF